MLRSFRLLLAAFALAAPLALAGLSGPAEAAAPRRPAAQATRHVSAHPPRHHRPVHVKKRTTHPQQAVRTRHAPRRAG